MKMLVFYTIIFALFFNQHNAAPNNVNKLFRSIEKSAINKGKSTENLNVDDLKFNNYPVTFACISEKDQFGFYMAVVNGTMPAQLLQRLDNGRGLSLFFHGAINHVTIKYGLMYYFAKEWFSESGNNICIVSYNFTMEIPLGCNPLDLARIEEYKIEAVKRLEYVAKLGRDLISGIIDTCWEDEDDGRCLDIGTQVDIIGFNFGAHVAARTCAFIKQKTGQSVRMLLALDPSRTPPIMVKPKTPIKKGLANYVQVIHTTVEGKNGGVFEKSGDVDVYLKYKPGQNQQLIDGLDFYVHIATATKRLYVLASEKGSGTMIKIGRQKLPEPKSNECIVGIYGTIPKVRGKKFIISVADRTEILKTALNLYADRTIFFE